LAKYRKYVNSLLIGLSLASSNVYALDDSRLWLPTKYSTLFLSLKEAAAAAEVLDRCVTILRGTLDLEKSTTEQPIYRFLCRQASGLTYNELVDGLTMETLTTKVVVQLPPTAEELELQKIEEEKQRVAAEEATKQYLWQLCEKELNSKIGLMDGVRWISDYPPEPDVYEAKGAVFTLEFDAKDMYGKALHYRTRCNITADENVSLVVRTRKVDQ
jgi:hypothetical protein